MGQLMDVYKNGFDRKFHPEITPSNKEPSKFDPLYGFKEGRPEKKMIATEEEMVSAKIPLKDRDFCAHLLLPLLQCRRENWPWVAACKHEMHVHEACQYEEFVDRMKDYEREKRLLRREARLGRSSG